MLVSVSKVEKVRGKIGNQSEMWKEPDSPRPFPESIVSSLAYPEDSDFYVVSASTNDKRRLTMPFHSKPLPQIV